MHMSVRASAMVTQDLERVVNVRQRRGMIRRPAGSATRTMSDDVFHRQLRARRDSVGSCHLIIRGGE